MNDKILVCIGKLTCFSEQGMEGGQLAIIDINFIKLYTPKYGLQENEKVWDDNDNTKAGTTSNPETYLDGSWVPSRDPILDEPDYKISSLFCGEERGDLDADKRLMEKYNFRMKYTQDKANDIYGVGNWKFRKPHSEIILNDGSIVMMGGTPNCEPKRPYSIPLAEFSRVTVIWNDGTRETKRKSDSLLVKSWSYEGLHILNETDYLKVIDQTTGNPIIEGQINLIPLKTFSQTKIGHFENGDWEKYFTEEYYAEMYREKNNYR